MFYNSRHSSFLGINCIITISLTLKVYRNGGMSTGHPDKDGMDRESPFHENWMSSGMSMDGTGGIDRYKKEAP